MRRIFLGSVAVIYLLIVLGCAAGTSTMSTANLTYPVNVGPVKHIKGKPSLTCKSQSAFAIEAKNSELITHDSVASRSKYINEGQNKFDVELMRYSIDGKGMVFNINNIDYGSYQGGFFLMVYKTESWVGIKGNICRLD